MKAKIVNLENKLIGELDLDLSIFGVDVRKDILNRVVEWQRSKRRSGTHKTKTISEISGTTKKPYKQKGTGNARQGSMRSAQFRGGSTIFGPVVRSHEYSLNKKIRKIGLKMALSIKLAENKLMVIDNIKCEDHKTSNLVKKIDKFNFKKILIIDDIIDENFKKAAANIKNFNFLSQIGANVYDILKSDCILLTSEAIDKLTERLK